MRMLVWVRGVAMVKTMMRLASSINVLHLEHNNPLECEKNMVEYAMRRELEDFNSNIKKY